jgi:transposase
MHAGVEVENVQLKQLLQEQTSLIETLRLENQRLQHKFQALLKRLGLDKKSEAIDPAQLQLLMAGLAAEVPSPPQPLVQPRISAPMARGKAVRQPLPKHLETEDIILEPVEVKEAPERYRKIGEEVTVELDYLPGRFLQRRFIRPKYVRLQPSARTPSSPADVVSEAIAEICQKENGIIVAPLPPRLMEKGLPGPGLLAYVVISKYEDHLPLFRQEKIYRERYGVKISRQTLAEWMELTAFWLKPIYELMKKQLMAGSYLQVDETPIRYLDPDQPGKAQLGYLWVYGVPGGDVIFDWQTSRGKEAPAQMLKDFKGQLQADGYGVYPSLVKDRPLELRLLACLAHVRREFYDVREEDRRAAWFLRQIGHLYQIEKRLREARAGPALRQAVRVAEAGPVLERISKALVRLAAKLLPKSGLGSAVAYARGQWPHIMRYLEDGRVEIDNNLIENAIRPTALGKKNFLFIGHPRAGWYSAVIYSILGSCRRHGIDPHAYLRDVLQRLPTMKNIDLASITPAAWAKANKAQRPTA